MRDDFAFCAEVVLWYLLEFRFWHAFGLGVVAWGAATLLLLPPLLGKTEEVARQKATMKTAWITWKQECA